MLILCWLSLRFHSVHSCRRWNNLRNSSFFYRLITCRYITQERCLLSFHFIVHHFLSVNFSLIATLHIIARHCCLINASTSSSGNFRAGVQGVVLLDEGDSVNWRRFLDDWLDGFRSCWHAKFVFYQLLMMSDWMISEIVDTYLCLCFTGYTQTQDILSG